MIPTLPEQSDDIYRYIWDGKLQYHGLNPYTYAPNNPILKPFHSEQLPHKVNFPHIKTIYPPMAQLVFRLSYTLFGESMMGLKFLFLLFQLGSSVIFYLILRIKNKDHRWIIFFAWNPLLIMETTINGHLDILMVFFLLMSLWFFYRKTENREALKENSQNFFANKKIEKKPPVLSLKNNFIFKDLIFSGASLACAIHSKLIPIILPPLLFLHIINTKSPKPLSINLKRTFSQVLHFIIPLLTILIGLYTLYFKSIFNMFLTALNYSTYWYFNNPIFHILLSLFKDNGTAHLFSFILFICVYMVILFSPLQLEKKIFFIVTMFVIANPTLHPWYLIILLSLLCIYPSLTIVFWSGLIIFSYIVVYKYKLTGIWSDSLISMFLEYLPLALVFLIAKYIKKSNHITYLENENPTIV